jgi:DNA polymerase
MAREKLKKYLAQQVELGHREAGVAPEKKPAAKMPPATTAPSVSVGVVAQSTLFGGAGASVKDNPVRPDPQRTLDSFYHEIKDCVRCSLGQTRTKFVFGVGNPKADIMFVGEAPGREEDLQGEPFVGRAGKLLDKILEATKFKREDVYIANVLKCRPPENRDPQPEEMETCSPYLMEQIRLIGPKFIVCLGRIAAIQLLNTKLALGKLRGTFHDFYGTKLMVTYHPAALLRFPDYKKDVWEDMKMLRKAYDGLEL